MSKLVKYEKQESGAKEIRIRLPEIGLPQRGLLRYLMLGGIGFMSFLGAIVFVALAQPIISALIPGPSKDAPGHLEPPANEQLSVGASNKSEDDATPSAEPQQTVPTTTPEPEPVTKDTEPSFQPSKPVEPEPAPPPAPPRASGPGNFDSPPPAPYYDGSSTGPGNL